MHAYLPAIGFGQIKKKSQLQQLLSSVQNFPDQVQKIRLWFVEKRICRAAFRWNIMSHILTVMSVLLRQNAA